MEKREKSESRAPAHMNPISDSIFFRIVLYCLYFLFDIFQCGFFPRVIFKPAIILRWNFFLINFYNRQSHKIVVI